MKTIEIKQSEHEFEIKIEQRENGVMLVQEDDNWVYVENENLKQLSEIIHPESSERIKELELAIREMAMRTNLTFPTTEQEEDWFSQGTNHTKSDYFERFNKLIESLTKTQQP